MHRHCRVCLLGVLIALALLATSAPLAAQRFGRAYAGPGTVSNVKWSADGQAVYFTSEEKRFRLDLENLTRTEVNEDDPEAEPSPTPPRATGRPGSYSETNTGTYVGRPSRGRQYTQVNSPDGKWEAHYENWNVVLKPVGGGEPVQVTTEGNEGVHYGTASWVYGEELRQTRAMWWTPDSKKLLYYKFDDRQVKPFYLLRGWSEINTQLYPEYYAKAGADNPIAELFVYDLASQTSLRVDIGGSGDEYVYGVRLSPGGDTMLVNWTDRLQQILKVMAIDLETGKCRLVVEERQDTWQTNSPSMRFLADQQRFLWPTERTGYTHYELRNLDGELLAPLTTGSFECSLVDVDEERNLVSFTANSCPSHPYYTQFHLVDLDGRNQRRVTTTDLHHSNFQLSPDRKWLVAQYEAVNTPPCTALYRTSDGQRMTLLAESDPASAANLAEEFHFRSDDDQFDIYGILYKPQDFDAGQSYPVINSLYGGPGSVEYRPNYVASERSECRDGYLVVKVNNRGTGGRSKKFLGAAYLRLGDIDIQDHADAIRYLADRPYFDASRVGIVGHSYGGFMAAMGIFKHPDVYAAAVDRAGPTDWQNYDTIYTERYMSTPQLNPEGYKNGAAMTYVDQFRGQILIMHGMLDDNVHPNNAFQLIEAMDKAGKPYESRFWPNGGHGLGVGANETQKAFFDRVLQPQPAVNQNP